MIIEYFYSTSNIYSNNCIEHKMGCYELLSKSTEYN